MKKLKILVTGSGGLLGSEVVRVLSKEDSFWVKGVTRQELDITKGMDVAIWLERLQPDVVINCAALSNVDYCEEHVGQAYEVNAEGVKNLCLPLEEMGGKLIHVSTDYVFDGDKLSSYVETDSVNPINHYGKSKLKGEEYVRRYLPDSLILRVQWLYGERGTNFASSVIREVTYKTRLGKYRFITDRIGSPIRVTEISSLMKLLIQKNKKGLFHVGAQGACSYAQFGEEVFKLNGYADVSSAIDFIQEIESGRRAKRPSYSVLSSSLIERELEIEMPSWTSILKNTIENLKKNEKEFFNVK